MGKSSVRLEDALSVDNFDVNNLPYITLIGNFQLCIYLCEKSQRIKAEFLLLFGLASTIEPQLCPLEGLYGLHGAIGPPYVTSRHKRNHNKAHHHHHENHKR